MHALYVVCIINPHNFMSIILRLILFYLLFTEVIEVEEVQVSESVKGKQIIKFAFDTEKDQPVSIDTHTYLYLYICVYIIYVSNIYKIKLNFYYFFLQSKLVRAPTPYPKELKAHARHARNYALKKQGSKESDTSEITDLSQVILLFS